MKGLHRLIMGNELIGVYSSYDEAESERNRLAAMMTKVKNTEIMLDFCISLQPNHPVFEQHHFEQFFKIEPMKLNTLLVDENEIEIPDPVLVLENEITEGEYYPEDISAEEAEKIFPGATVGPWFDFPGSYDALIQGMGYQVIFSITDNEYSGDSRVFFQHGKLYGHVIFGWGSCSGCDALLACQSYGDVAELFNDLRRSIKWLEKDPMLEYFKTKDWVGEYHGSSQETQDYIEQVISYLTKK